MRYVSRPGTSITYGIVQAGPHIEDGIPYIKTSDMSGPALPLEGYSKTTVEIDASYSRSKVAAGDLVIAIRASVGKCLPVPAQLDGANLTQGTAKIAPGDLVDAGFLMAFINAQPVQTYLNSVSKGATFKEITIDTLRKTPVLLPPLAEQRTIGSHVRALTEQFQELIDGAEAAEALLLERRSALISAAVTGKIDVRILAPQPEAVAA
jgi:type I restriction enzyme S subunit